VVKRANQARKWDSAASRRLMSLAEGAQSVEDAIARIVERTLDGIPCPPTNLDAVMQRLGVARCEPREDLPIVGGLERHGDELVIVHAPELPRARRRFTIAHELAHVIFESTGPNCPRHGRELERLCDMIGAELLLPRAVVSRMLRRSFSLTDVFALASMFDVSLQSAARRCADFEEVTILHFRDQKALWCAGTARSLRTDPALLRQLRKIEHVPYGKEDWSADTKGPYVNSSLEWRHKGSFSLVMLRPN